MTNNSRPRPTFVPSELRRIFCSLFFVAAAAVAIGAVASSRTNGQGGSASQSVAAQKIAPWVTEHTANGQQAEFFVVLADQADLSHAANLQTKAEKGRYVYNTLLNKSQTTQGPILQWLRERGIEHQSFYIVNGILVKGSREIAEALASRPDVARVEGNPVIQNPLPEAVEGPAQPEAPVAIEPGITYTHAPQVWALGFTGQQIVIASADTGVRWTHNALKPHYRGWDGVVADHDYNWHDSIHNSVSNPCGNDSTFPCDDFFHGSHTTGTAIGDDGMGNQIGMAPGAKWIGCRNMDVGNGTPARYIECMQWFLAPTRIGGGDPDPTKAPDITINSWGCPTSEGCSVDTLQAAVEAQATAGIMMVVAAGNSGLGCSTVSDPPSFYAASYTAGALNTGTDTIASFSSRGPVTIDGSGRTKPDIAAPGTSTRSASNSSDTAYAIASGTSMATPHIAGAMALLWSAQPGLRHQITASRDALNNTAVHIASSQCGTAGPPNNVYGWGRVDILAAVGPGPSPTPTPTPTATHTPTPTPTATFTPTPTATATATATATVTPTATATATATPTPTATPTATATPSPAVTTNPATNVASFSATLNGSVNPRGSTTTVRFQYGPTTSYGHTTATQTKTGNTSLPITANISGLSASTTYHFRIVATNGGGTSFGPDRTFTTTGPPSGTTNPATNVASSSARLNGSVNPHGLTTTVRFQYGKTTSYGSTTANQTKTGNTTQNVAANISGLAVSTTYHFRIVVTNSLGTRYGSDRTFTTFSATGPPVVTTNPATNVMSSSARLNGTAYPHGLTTAVRFQYKRTTSYGNRTPNQTKSGNNHQNVSANISGLSAHSTYHFRIVATNSVGTRYGSDRTFTTQ